MNQRHRLGEFHSGYTENLPRWIPDLSLFLSGSGPPRRKKKKWPKLEDINVDGKETNPLCLQQDKQ